MKRSLIRKSLILVLPMLAAISALANNSGTAVLQLQKAPGITGPWQALPANLLAITPEGNLADGITNSAFYRLQISTTSAAGGPIALPLQSVPPLALQWATNTLADNPGGYWPAAMLAPYAYPVYDAALTGSDPAYLEFKVIPVPLAASTNPVAGTPIQQSPDLGYILVSLTPNDVPIPEMAFTGPTMVEQLRRAAQSSTVKAVRYDVDYLVAEDAAGNFVTAIGTTPSRPSTALLGYAGTTFTGMVVSNVVIQAMPDLGLTNMAYTSYADFKNDYISGPVMSFARARRAERGALKWNFMQGTAPPTVTVPTGTNTLVLPTLSILTFSLQDPTLANGTIGSAGGISFYATSAGSTLLTLMLTDLTQQFYVLQVTTNGTTVRPKVCSWTPLVYGWAREVPTQRCAYYQEKNLPGCCRGWSGCGPTAWAIVYGVWNQDPCCGCLLAGCEPSPGGNDDAVRSCIEGLFGEMGTWCVWFSDQAATWPWRMHDGRQWGANKGYSVTSSAICQIFGDGAGARQYAMLGIRWNLPTILGVGSFPNWHYVVAFRWVNHVKYCDGKWAGYQTFFFCNWGDGGPFKCVDDSGLWFGMYVTASH